MNSTRQLQDLGQNLWVDNITRGLVVALYEHGVFTHGTIWKALQVPNG